MLTRRNSAATIAAGAALIALGCQDDFPLGSWGQLPTGAPSTTATAPSASMSATSSATVPPPPPPPPPASPTCGETGTPVPLTTAGNATGTTNVYTNWTWPTPVDSLEWDLVIETDPPNDGYYFAHQFSFVNSGTSGFLGLQAHGGYQDPGSTTPNKIDFTKMAVFWIAGPPTDAELGDFTGTNGRKAPITQYGVEWMTIHGKLDWTACHVYHLKLGPAGTNDAGDIWYGAWITDKTTGTEYYLGRMLIPAGWGQLQTLSVMQTTRIDNAGTDVPVVSCADPEPTAAIFGTPTANDGTILPADPRSRFAMPPRCATSRYTVLPEGVRHELSVQPTP